MKGITFNYTKKVLESISKQMPQQQMGYQLMKVKGFCIN